MPSTKRSIAEANGIGANEDEHRAASARAAPRRRQVSTDERKPTKPPPASDGTPVDTSSLLILGLDSLSHLLRYFGVVSLARFGGVCRQFRHLAIPRWERLDVQIPAKGRSKAESPRLRVVRYHMAVAACKEFETKIAEDHNYHEDANSRCQFPGSKFILDTDTKSLGADVEGTDQNPRQNDELFLSMRGEEQRDSSGAGILHRQILCSLFQKQIFFLQRFGSIELAGNEKFGREFGRFDGL